MKITGYLHETKHLVETAQEDRMVTPGKIRAVK